MGRDNAMNDFLLKYYRQLHFNSMPAEIRAQFNAYAKTDDFRGNMKSWKSDLMHRDPSGKWVNNALPDPTGQSSRKIKRPQNFWTIGSVRANCSPMPSPAPRPRPRFPR